MLTLGKGVPGVGGGDLVSPLLADYGISKGVVVGVGAGFGVKGEMLGLGCEVGAAYKLDTSDVAFL